MGLALDIGLAGLALRIKRVELEVEIMRFRAWNKRLGNLLAELDIDYLDLLPTFREARRRVRAELFRRSDQHWNPEGHALAARELAATLERAGYLVSHR